MLPGRGRLILAAGVLLGLAAPAGAEQPTPQQIDAIKSACRWDFMSNCSGVPRGGREAVMCLKDHLAKLSPACQSAVNAIVPKSPPPATPTAAPAPSPAPAAPAPAAASASPPPPPPAPAAAAPRPSPAPAAGTAAPPPPAAPKKHAAVPAPKPARPAAPAPTQATAAPPAPAAAPLPADLGPIPPLRPLVRLQILRACKAEHDTLCGQVPPGQGRIVECLAAHAAVLSPGCRDAILSAK